MVELIQSRVEALLSVDAEYATAYGLRLGYQRPGRFFAKLEGPL